MVRTWTYCRKKDPKKHQHTTFDKLQKKIERDLSLKANNFKRTYAGYWMQSQGAFKWTAVVNGHFEIGSTYTAAELLKAKQLCIESDGEVWPNNYYRVR